MHSGPELFEAGNRVRHALENSPSGPFPVVVAYDERPGWREMVEHLATLTSRVVVAKPVELAVAWLPAAVLAVDLPATTADVLTVCGAQPGMYPAHIADDRIGPEVAGHGPALQRIGHLPSRGGPESLTHRVSSSAWTDSRQPHGANIATPASSASADSASTGTLPRYDGGSDDDFFGSAGHRAKIVVFFSGRGGAGKSSFSAALAATAAARGKRVVLVDNNAGQSDQRLFLRLSKRVPLPSVYDSARSGNPADAVASPDQLTALRGSSLEPVPFALVAAPPDDLAADPLVTPRAYLDVVNHYAERADLIVVDTQIVESRDDSGMVSGFVLPLLRSGAWGVGITDASSPGIMHLISRLASFTKAGVRPDRMLTLLNKRSSNVIVDEEKLGRSLGVYSRFLGTVPLDVTLIEHTNQGRLLSDVPVLAHWVEVILSRIFPDIPVRTAPYDPALSNRRRGSLFGRLNRR